MLALSEHFSLPWARPDQLQQPLHISCPVQRLMIFFILLQGFDQLRELELQVLVVLSLTWGKILQLVAFRYRCHMSPLAKAEYWASFRGLQSDQNSTDCWYSFELTISAYNGVPDICLPMPAGRLGPIFLQKWFEFLSE
jgi:hypothetical protein